jgi:hypothetical protein
LLGKTCELRQKEFGVFSQQHLCNKLTYAYSLIRSGDKVAAESTGQQLLEQVLDPKTGDSLRPLYPSVLMHVAETLLDRGSLTESRMKLNEALALEEVKHGIGAPLSMRGCYLQSRR